MTNKFAKQYQVLGVAIDELAALDPRQKAGAIYEASCRTLGLDPAAVPDLSRVREKYRFSQLAFHKLEVIRDAITGDREADWDDYSDKKWGSWFYMDSPGFRFDGVAYTDTNSYSGLGSRLCCETEEQAEFLARECIAFWADFYDKKLGPSRTGTI